MKLGVFQDSGYLSLDFMNQKGHFIQKQEKMLQRSDVPVEKGEPLALEIFSFLECLIDSKSLKRMVYSESQH